MFSHLKFNLLTFSSTRRSSPRPSFLEIAQGDMFFLYFLFSMEFQEPPVATRRPSNPQGDPRGSQGLLGAQGKTVRTSRGAEPPPPPGDRAQLELPGRPGKSQKEGQENQGEEKELGGNPPRALRVP